MISLSVAKQTVMDQPYFKKLEIFEILENGSEWIFIINGINDKGTLLMPQPFVRLVNKENGEIKTLNYNDDFSFISLNSISAYCFLLLGFSSVNFDVTLSINNVVLISKILCFKMNL